MGKSVAVALLAALAAVVGTVGLARPRRQAPTTAREYPAMTPNEGVEAVAYVVVEARDAALDRLLGELRNGTTLERARAARKLAKLRHAAAPAIPDLVAFLTDAQDGWARVRDEIEDVLVAAGEDAVPAALDLIAQSNVAGRQSGIRILARIRGEAAVATLAALLADPAVGECAAEWLAKRGEVGRAALLAAVADPSIPLKILADAFVDAGKPMALPLGVLLSVEDPKTRERAAAVLLKLGKNARPARDAISRALMDPAFGDKLALVETLQFLDRVPPGLAPVLADLARSLLATEAAAEVREIRVRGGFAPFAVATRNHELAPLRALAALGPAANAALPTLVEIMASGDPDAGAEAARAYWRVGGSPGVAVDHLLANLAAFPDGGYHPAFSVLQEIGGDAVAAIPALLRELESENLRRAQPAASALAAMGDAGVTAVREWLRSGQPVDSTIVIFAFGETLRDELIARYGDEARGFFEFVDAPHEIFATVAADGADDPLTELRRKLREPDHDKRCFTFLGLRALGEKAAPAIPELVALLADDGQRAEAAATLGSIGPAAAAAVPALEPYLEDPTYAGRDATINALFRITGDTRYRDLQFGPTDVQAGDDWALPRLIEGLSHKSTWWRRECAEALGRLRAAARPAAADLERLATDENEDENVRDAAREALVKVGR